MSVATTTEQAPTVASYRNLVAECEMLKATLEECLEYFEDRYDVVDGEYSQPTANREMQLGQMIESALGRRP